jgi:ankyrin repeat protein
MSDEGLAKQIIRAHTRKDFARVLGLVRSKPSIMHAGHLRPEQIICSNFRIDEGTPFSLLWTSCNRIPQDWPRFRRLVRKDRSWLETWDVNPHGSSMLHLAAGSCRSSEAHIPEFLIDEGMDPNCESIGSICSQQIQPGGSKPISGAVGNNNFAAAEVLLARGANILDCNIHWPAMKGQHRGVRFLLDRGFPVDRRNRENGNTPLHEAARRSNSVKTVAMLLDAGAELNATNNDGQTPLTLAINKNKQKVVAFLQAQDARE